MISKGLSKRFLQIFFTVFTIILIIFAVVVGVRGRADNKPIDCDKIAIEGTYSYDGGSTSVEFDREDIIPPTREGSMTIEGHFTSDIEEGKTVFMFVQGLKVRIFQNGKLIVDHPEISDDAWLSFKSDGISASDDIHVELDTDKEYLYNVHFRKFLERVYVADKYDLIGVLMRKNSLHLIACLVIAIMGVSILIYRACFKGIKDYNQVGLRSCGMMMIMGGITCYLDYNYITLVSRNLYFLRFCDFMTQAMIVIFLSAYLKRYVDKESSKKRCDIIVVIMILFLSIYMIRYIVTAKVQEFDWLFVVFVLAVIIMLIVELKDVFTGGEKMVRQSRMAFDSMLMLVAAFIIEMVYFVLTGTYIVKVVEIALLIFSVMQYYLLVSTNVENYYKSQHAKELENELIQNKIKLMLGQIQPHFLYNAIGTIRALCVRRPEEARNALDYFAKYLRANMDSISEEGCIPFEKELDHVKSYLYIEKLRFGDLLEIEYDIKTTEFECPPLMLQTMVENAVKHGLLPKKDGGRIKIATAQTGSCYEIKIEDDGVGFDTTKPLEEGRSHIGVDNTRQRVMALCNGSLNIGSRIGIGTTITITIPKKKRSGGGYESNIG